MHEVHGSTTSGVTGAGADAATDAARAAEEHHAELWAELTARVHAVVEAVRAGAGSPAAEPARRALLEHLDAEVLPHVAAEERMVYSLARGAGQRALVAVLEIDHRALLRQVDTLRHAPTPFDAALAARALLLLFGLRMEKEETVLLPALEEQGLDVGVLVGGRPEIVGAP